MANRHPTGNPVNIDKKIVDSFLENQKLQALNDAKEIQLREKQIAYDAEYSRDLLERQHDFVKNREKQNRYNIITYAVIAFAFVILICGFIIYLISYQKDELANTIMTWGGRVVALTISFLLGRLSALKSMKNKPEDTSQVVDP